VDNNRGGKIYKHKWAKENKQDTNKKHKRNKQKIYVTHWDSLLYKTESNSNLTKCDTLSSEDTLYRHAQYGEKNITLTDMVMCVLSSTLTYAKYKSTVTNWTLVQQCTKISRNKSWR
jgi:hypothetical protein